MNRPEKNIKTIERTFDRLEKAGKYNPTFMEICAYVGDPTITCGEIKATLVSMESKGLIEAIGPFWTRTEITNAYQKKTAENTVANFIPSQENSSGQSDHPNEAERL